MGIALAMLIAFSVVVSQATSTFDLGNLTAGCDDAKGLDCGGHGTCVASVCQCDPYWSKLTDFVDFQECATSLIAIYLLWGLNVAFVLYAYFKSAAMIVLRVEVFLETRKTRRNYTLWQNKGLLSVLCIFGITMPFQFMLAVGHFVDPTMRVGFDIFPSVCFFMAKLGFYLCLYLVQSTMFAHVLKGIKGAERLIPMNTFFQGFIASFSTITGGLAFVTLLNFQDDVAKQVAVMQAYYAIQTVLLFINAAGAQVLIRLVNRVFDNVKDISNKGDIVKKRINDLQGTASKQAFVQSVIYLLLAAVPFFINKHQYFLPMSWLTMAMIAVKVAMQFSSDRNAKTIMERLGLRWTGDSSNGGSSSFNKFSNKNAVQNNNNTHDTGNATATAVLATYANVHEESFNVISPMSSTRTGKHPGRIQPVSSVLSDGTLLDELMDPENPLHSKFMKFVESKYAINEVSLFGEIIKYRNAAEGKARAKLGKRIVKDYFEDEAPKAVDVPYLARSKILEAAQASQWTASLFEEVRRILIFELRGNFLAKFEDLVEKEKAAKPESPKGAKSPKRHCGLFLNGDEMTMCFDHNEETRFNFATLDAIQTTYYV